MRIAGPLAICGLAALAGCTSIADRGTFHLTAEQVSGAWSHVMVRAQLEAEEQGLSPLWDPQGPYFSGAACRWIEPGRKALCRYRVSRGPYRPGRERQWVDEEGELYLTEMGWDFGG
jgi:hypothetical protein